MQKQRNSKNSKIVYNLLDDVDDVILPVPRPASFENIPLCIPIIILPSMPPLIDLNSNAFLNISINIEI